MSSVENVRISFFTFISAAAFRSSATKSDSAAPQQPRGWKLSFDFLNVIKCFNANETERLLSAGGVCVGEMCDDVNKCCVLEELSASRTHARGVGEGPLFQK